jgi:antitoxin component of MazEF toxin-antitoxin module
MSSSILVDEEEPEPSKLDELLAKVTPENIHPEVDFGPPVGNEVW